MIKWALFLFSTHWVWYADYDSLEECRYYEYRIQEERQVEGLCLEVVRDE